MVLNSLSSGFRHTPVSSPLDPSLSVEVIGWYAQYASPPIGKNMKRCSDGHLLPTR